MSKKNFFQKKDLKNDFENRSQVPTIVLRFGPPRGGHKNKIFQFLKTLLESISRALLKVLKPFFSKLPLDRTFCRGTRLVCTFHDASTEGQRFSALVPTIYFVELWSSGQALESAVLRRTRREKCRKVLKGRGSRRRVMPTRKRTPIPRRSPV